jgi:hypothetical protein
MNLYTFLGTGNYEKTTYVWTNKENQRKEYTTRLMPLAVTEIFQPEEVFVFTTPEARETQYFRKLQDHLSGQITIVDTPTGDTEENLWKIFDLCVEHIDQNETINVDITHSYRYLPYILQNVLHYVTRVKNVEVERVLYGNFEAREDGRTPIIDLSPSLALVDWLEGVHIFRETGDSSGFGQRLMEFGQFPSDTGRADSDQLSGQLQQVGEGLVELSKALDMTRAEEVQDKAKKLKQIMNEEMEEIQQWAPPFRAIIHWLEQQLTQLESNNSNRKLDIALLEDQLRLIRYYHERERIVPMLTLAREWLLNLIMFLRETTQHDHSTITNWKERQKRRIVKKEVTKAVQRMKGYTDESFDWFNNLPRWKQLRDLWEQVADKRNDLAHCGFRNKPTSVTRFYDDSKKLLAELETFFEKIREAKGSS